MRRRPGQRATQNANRAAGGQAAVVAASALASVAEQARCNMCTNLPAGRRAPIPRWPASGEQGVPLGCSPAAAWLLPLPKQDETWMPLIPGSALPGMPCSGACSSAWRRHRRRLQLCAANCPLSFVAAMPANGSGHLADLMQLACAIAIAGTASSHSLQAMPAACCPGAGRRFAQGRASKGAAGRAPSSICELPTGTLADCSGEDCSGGSRAVPLEALTVQQHLSTWRRPTTLHCQPSARRRSVQRRAAASDGLAPAWASQHYPRFPPCRNTEPQVQGRGSCRGRGARRTGGGAAERRSSCRRRCAPRGCFSWPPTPGSQLDRVAMSSAPPSTSSPALDAFLQRRENIAGDIAKLEKQVGSRADVQAQGARLVAPRPLKLASPALHADIRAGVRLLHRRLHQLRQRRQGARRGGS